MEQKALPSIAPSPACAAQLRQWAMDATDDRYPKLPTRAAILALANESQTRAMLNAARLQTAPATPAEISRHFLALAVVYPSQALSEEQMTLKFRIFCEDLSGIPERVLAKACANYRRAINPPNTFFPSPGQLLAHCETDMREMRKLRRGFDMIERALDAAPAIAEASPTFIDAGRMREIRAGSRPKLVTE
jgi:hypothetical protein